MQIGIYKTKFKLQVGYIPPSVAAMFSEVGRDHYTLISIILHLQNIHEPCAALSQTSS